MRLRFPRRAVQAATATLGAALMAGAVLTAVPAIAAPPVHLPGAIGQTWLRTPDLGTPVTVETCVAGGLRCQQQFRGGLITWSPWAGAQILRNGDILTHYLSLGGVAGGMGVATTGKQTGLREGGQWQGFEQGGIFYHPTAGTHAVRAGMWATWSGAGREWGILGFPTSTEYIDERGGVRQDFQRGSTFWREGVGGVPTWQANAAGWRETGGLTGPLGYPTGWEKPATGGGAWQPFEGGAMWWSAATGPVMMRGGFWGSYIARDAERGPLGYPTAPERAVEGGAEQSFQGARLYWSATTERVVAVTPGDILARWDQEGGPASPLGLPTGEKTSFLGGYYQRFEGGTITWGPGIGARIVDQATFDAWLRDPGRYGWPTRDTAATDRGALTVFERGELIVKDGHLYSAEEIGSSTAVLICDSQCDGDSWGEQGARALGFTHIVERAYGGGGYAAVAGTLGSSVTAALVDGRVLLPEGNPGLVMLTLGGNDATQGRTDAEVVDGMRTTLDQICALYPNAQIVVNGVMSRTDADHARRRAIDELVTAEAARQGLPAVSVAGWGTTHGAAYQDAVHLTQAGHNTIAPAYADALRKALR